MDLVISQAPTNSGAYVIVAEGEVDIATVGRLETALKDAIAAGHNPLLLDLGRCAYMDSTGLRAVLCAHNALRVNGGDPPAFAVATTQPSLLKLFELTRLDQTISIVADREAGFTLLGRKVEPQPS